MTTDKCNLNTLSVLSNGQISAMICNDICNDLLGNILIIDNKSDEHTPKHINHDEQKSGNQTAETLGNLDFESPVPICGNFRPAFTSLLEI